jgi:uncharacterized protein DUF6448
MRRLTWAALGATATAAAAIGGFLFAQRALAHCDTLSGPVVAAAKRALETGDLTPVLKWIRAADESEIRALFKKALTVRKLGGDARDLADRAFFENVVRVHRTGEGAPFEGLKPEAAAIEPAIAIADEALETGNLAGLQAALGGVVERAVKERFDRVVAAKPHAEESVAKGRAYVAAYVDYVHFVEKLHAQTGGEATAAPPVHVH